MRNRRVKTTLLGNYETHYTVADVVVVGKYAYVAEDLDGLLIIDVTNPSSPFLSGSYDTPGYAVGIFIAGNYAYIADVNSLQIIDIKNPISPIFKGSYPTTFSSDVKVVGNYAYVTNARPGGQLQIIDLSDISKPVLKGSFTTVGGATQIILSNNYAYLADNQVGLLIVDISNATHPILKSSSLGFAIAGVSVLGNNAYVTTRSGVVIVDISNPAQPVRKSQYLTVDPVRLVVANDFIFVANRYLGLQIIDIADINNPLYAGSYPTLSDALGVTVVDNRIYLADTLSGLLILEASQITPRLAFQFEGFIGYLYGSTVSGSYAYVAADAGVYIVDISNPLSPAFKGVDPGYSRRIVALGNYLYVAGDGLRVSDISNPVNPILLSRYAVGVCFSVIIVNSTAYLGVYNQGLQILNITKPVLPSLIGNYTLPNIIKIALKASDVYLIAGTELRIIDVANPRQPTYKGHFLFSGMVTDLVLSGNYAYVAAYNAGFQIIDISNPVNPIHKGSYVTAAFTIGVDLIGSYAYVTNRGISSFLIIDVSDLSRPYLVGYYQTPGELNLVTIAGRYAYVCNGHNANLFIFDNITPSQEPVLVNNRLMIYRGQTRTLTSDFLSATDVDNDPGTLLFNVESVFRGRFQLAATPGIPVYSFQQFDITNGLIQFVHDGSELGPSYKVNVDDGYGACPHIPVAANITFITVPPSLVSNKLTIIEGQTIYITTQNIRALSANIMDPDLTFTVRNITHSQFEQASNPGIAIFSFTQQQILSNAIRYAHDDSKNPPRYMLSVGVANLNSPFVWANITYINRNDPPKLLANRLNITEGETVTITSDNLSATDPDGHIEDLIFEVSGLQHGVFTTNNSAASISSFPQRSVMQGRIKFTQDGSKTPPSYFVTVSDGQYTDGPSAAEITFTPVHYPPTFQSNHLSIGSGQSVILTPSDLSAVDDEVDSKELVFTASAIQHGQFEYANNPGTAVNIFSQAKVQTADIRFLHDGSCTSPSYEMTVSDGLLSSKQAATINFIPCSSSGSNSDTLHNAIIGSVISGAIGLAFLATKLIISYCVEKRLKKAFTQGETVAERERAKFFREVIQPLAKKIFDAIKTTGFLGYRSEADTKTYIHAIERMALRLEELGMELDIEKLTPQKQRRLFNEIVRQAKRILILQYSCCSCAYLGSFFKPEVSPAKFDAEADTIAQAVYDELNEQFLVHLLPSSQSASSDLELQPVRSELDEKAADDLTQRLQQTEEELVTVKKSIDKIREQISPAATRLSVA